MPDNQYKEVLIVMVASIMVFLSMAASIVIFLYHYQRRRFQQQKQMSDLQQQFKEQSLKAELEIQEHTFHAISQEIHDNVAQSLILARVQIHTLHENGQAPGELLTSVQENIVKALTDLRDLSKSLNSDRIRSASIHETFLQEADRINKTGILRAEVAVEGEAREIEPQKKLILFRILQECIQNCVKHAEASEIYVLFRYLAKGIHITIRDDGKGFDTEDIFGNSSGQGLENIRTRIQLTGGSHHVKSRPQEGTEITLMIPYD
ncbi:MAG TPA: ATP-binding protein [Puia sp.]|nr:ATP-binding protein [Puia sp.]